MREFAAPLTVEVPRTGNLTDDVVRNAREAPDAVVLRRRRRRRVWHDVTAAAFLAEVTAVAKGMVAAGVAAGDRVALVSRTRYEWTLVDYAIWFAGAVSVPIYETSSAEQISWILRDSGATAVVAEASTHTARVASVRGDLPRSTTCGRWRTTPSTSSRGWAPTSPTTSSRPGARPRRRSTWRR